MTDEDLADFIARMRHDARVIREVGTNSALAYADGVEQTVRSLERRMQEQ